MAAMSKCFVGAGALAILLIVCDAAQVRLEQVDRGGEWLSWSPKERSTYVDGFITGYLQGTNRACDEHHPSDMPAARCLAGVEKYSKTRHTEASGPDFSAYTEVITEFYTQHPEYRGIPFVRLLQLLNDSNNKTADELYQMALKGEMRPVS
jgi:hypothetical protein